jgi:hypothetical protein
LAQEKSAHPAGHASIEFRSPSCNLYHKGLIGEVLRQVPSCAPERSLSPLRDCSPSTQLSHMQNCTTAENAACKQELPAKKGGTFAQAEVVNVPSTCFILLKAASLFAKMMNGMHAIASQSGQASFCLHGHHAKIR